MARFNEILVGRYNRSLQKLLSMKGQAVMPQLASELQPTFSFFSGAENRYLESWERFGIRQPAAAGGVGNITMCRFLNPAGSNVVAVLEKIFVFEAAADPGGPVLAINAPPSPAALAGGSNLGAALDPRGRPQSTCSLSFKNNSAAISGGTVILQMSLGATQLYWDIINTDIVEIPVLPGESYDIFANTANQGLTVSTLWRERFLEDSERA